MPGKFMINGIIEFLGSHKICGISLFFIRPLGEAV